MVDRAWLLLAAAGGGRLSLGRGRGAAIEVELIVAYVYVLVAECKVPASPTLVRIAQVCILLRSFSKLLSFASALPWAGANLQQTRCAEHDWCRVRRVPCSTSTPERVLVAVLGAYSSWPISWLAKRWQQPWHQLFLCKHFEPGAPIRALPTHSAPPPTRSIEQLASYTPKWMLEGREPTPGERVCSSSTRVLDDGSRDEISNVRERVQVTCGRMHVIQPLPQPVHVSSVRFSRFRDEPGSVRLSMRTNSYDNPSHWKVASV